LAADPLVHHGDLDARQAALEPGLEQGDEAELAAAGADAFDRGGADSEDGQPALGDRSPAAGQAVIGYDVLRRHRAGRGRRLGEGGSGGEAGGEDERGGEADSLQGFGVPVAGSTSVSPELEEPSEPGGSW